jgi:hypothetical protein
VVLVTQVHELDEYNLRQQLRQNKFITMPVEGHAKVKPPASSDISPDALIAMSERVMKRMKPRNLIAGYNTRSGEKTFCSTH